MATSKRSSSREVTSRVQDDCLVPFVVDDSLRSRLTLREVAAIASALHQALPPLDEVTPRQALFPHIQGMQRL